jgi:hypothetical protein
MPEHGPPLESELLPERVGVGGEVLPGHRRHGCADRTPVAAVVVEDDGVPVGEPSERRQRHVVEPGPAMHEQQRVTAADDFDEQ